MQITSATIIANRCVEVVASGPRGGTHEFTVHYDRHGKVSYGQRHKPSHEYYLPPLIPQDIRDAAWETYVTSGRC
jgi:hypothetical protein